VLAFDGKLWRVAPVNLTFRMRRADVDLPPILRKRVLARQRGRAQKRAAYLLRQRLQAETAAELDALLPAVLDKAFRRSCSIHA